MEKLDIRYVISKDCLVIQGVYEGGNVTVFISKDLYTGIGENSDAGEDED